MMICTMLVDIVFFGEALPERFAVCAKQVSHMLQYQSSLVTAIKKNLYSGKYMKNNAYKH